MLSRGESCPHELGRATPKCWHLGQAGSLPQGLPLAGMFLKKRPQGGSATAHKEAGGRGETQTISERGARKAGGGPLGAPGERVPPSGSGFAGSQD